MDKYDKQIARLTANHTLIKEQWLDGIGLFAFCTPSGKWDYRPDGCCCGCLTMVRADPERMAWTDQLTRAIRADRRLPKDVVDITVKHLPVFAAWQRRLEKELNRK